MEYIKSIIEKFNSDNLWIIEVFIIIFLSLILNLVQKRILRKIEQKLNTNRQKWDDAFIFAVRKPLSFIIWIIGFTFAADIVGSKSGATIFAAVAPTRDIGIIITIAWILLRFINYVEANVITQSGSKGEAKKIDQTTADAISKLLRISVIITSALVALQTLGFSVSGVLAFGGIGGIAIGFAAKDMLSNFFGGFMIYMDRPFTVGDWIKSPDRNIEGTVEKIGWRLTCIRTFDKRPLYIPNSAFTTIAVINPSRMSHRRIYETIGVRYDDIAKLPDIVNAVKKMLQEHPDIAIDQTMIVNFNSFAPSSLDFFIYTFTKTTSWIKYHQIKQDVLFKISEIITKHSAEIAFPTSTLHVADILQFSGLEK